MILRKQLFYIFYCRKNAVLNKPVAEFKEFERRFKFKPRFKPGFGEFKPRLKFFKFHLSLVFTV